jgi:hypothetical protein
MKTNTHFWSYLAQFFLLCMKWLKFNVHGSVHRKNIPIYISNKMQRYTVHFIWKLLYMFRMVPPPIITYNCIYNIWYLSHRYCYLPLAAGSSNGVTVL